MCDLNRLTDLAPGCVATVRLLPAESGLRGRLQALGVTPGTTIKCVRKSPLGDPTAYLIRGAVIALRAEDSACVFVQ